MSDVADLGDVPLDEVAEALGPEEIARAMARVLGVQVPVAAFNSSI